MTPFRNRWRLLALASLVLLIVTAVSPAGYSIPYVRKGSIADATPVGFSRDGTFVPVPDSSLLFAPIARASGAGVAPEYAGEFGSTGPVSVAGQWAHQGVILIGSWEWDDGSLAKVTGALGLLPQDIIPLLGNRELGPLHIVINKDGRMLSGTAPYGGPANYFSTNDGLNEVVLYPRQSVSTVLHELGHAYNLRHIDAKRYALIFLDPEMQSFMAATGWRVLSPEAFILKATDHRQIEVEYQGAFIWPRMSHDDPLEDFANSFAMYFLDREKLKAASPARYEWFKANVAR